MLEETKNIRVVFTVICGTDSCPPEVTLAKFRILSDNPPAQEQKAQVALERQQLVDTMMANLEEHTSGHPSLLEIAHYRMEFRNDVGELVEAGRDVFVGIAKVDSYVFRRSLDPKKLLEIDEPIPPAIENPNREYLNEMFRLIFKDLNNPGNNNFSWLTWVIVPLVEAFDGRFNPIGMGGSGR